MDEIYLQFLQLLNEAEVEYVVLGGYAVIVHGYVRATGDLDILIKNSPENADKIILALLRFGYGEYDFEINDFELMMIKLQCMIHDHSYIIISKAIPAIRRQNTESLRLGSIRRHPDHRIPIAGG